MKIPKLPKKYVPMVKSIEKGDAEEISHGLLIVLNDGYEFNDGTQSEFVESFRELIDKLSMVSKTE